MVYTVYFTDASGYFSEPSEFSGDVLMFGFDVRYSLSKIPVDDRVRITISDIIAHFFVRNPNKILFFVCDTKEQKQESRMRLFERWYKTCGQFPIEKLNEEIKMEEGNLYGSILLYRNNPKKPQIRQAFKQMRIDLEDKFEE